MSLRLTPSSIYLILVNLIPIIGVGFFGWSLLDILLAYWVENVVIGLYTILKMATAQGGGFIPIQSTSLTGDVALKVMFIVFFTVHFGGFTAGHLVFLLGFFGAQGVISDFGAVLSSAAIMFGMFMISHGISYWQNYIGQGEFRRSTVIGIMMSPYSRVVVMHLSVMAGVFLLFGLGSRVMASVLIVLLKIVVDLIAHHRQHRQSELAGIDLLPSTIRQAIERAIRQKDAL